MPPRPVVGPHPNRNYREPALTEIFAELRLESGLMPPAKYFEVVPDLTSAGLSEITMTQAVIGQALVQVTPRVQCWSLDKARLVQLSQDTVTANLVGKYPGWKSFRELFTSVEALLRKRDLLRPQTITLTTIDKVATDQGSFRLGRYVNCGGALVPRIYDTVTEACDVSLGFGVPNVDGFNRQMLLNVRKDAAAANIQLVCTLTERTDAAGIGAMLDALHDEANNWFEDSITDATREIMGIIPA